MIMSVLLMGASSQQSAIVYNLWYTSNIGTPTVTEIPTTTSYIQRDNWLNSVITANTIAETPAATQYFYMPTNNWLLTNNIATPAAVEVTAPTSYLQAS